MMKSSRTALRPVVLPVWVAAFAVGLLLILCPLSDAAAPVSKKAPTKVVSRQKPSPKKGFNPWDLDAAGFKNSDPAPVTQGTSSKTTPVKTTSAKAAPKKPAPVQVAKPVPAKKVVSKPPAKAVPPKSPPVKTPLTAKAAQTVQKPAPVKPTPASPVSAASAMTMSPEAAAAVQTLPPERTHELQQLAALLHQQDKTISNELRDDEEESMKDLAMLWQAAVERSGTIRYAIEKLSRRDATGAPVDDETFTKKMLQSLARLGGVAGNLWAANPAAFVGSAALQDFLSTSNIDPDALSRVSETDMLILAKTVETLQTDVLEKYYEYRHARDQWTLSQEAVRTMDQYYKRSTQREDALAESLAPIMEGLYERARQEDATNQQAYVSARNGLALLAGNDAVIALDEALVPQTAQR